MSTVRSCWECVSCGNLDIICLFCVFFFFLFIVFILFCLLPINLVNKVDYKTLRSIVDLEINRPPPGVMDGIQWVGTSVRLMPLFACYRQVGGCGSQIPPRNPPCRWTRGRRAGPSGMQLTRDNYAHNDRRHNHLQNSLACDGGFGRRGTTIIKLRSSPLNFFNERNVPILQRCRFEVCSLLNWNISVTDMR